MKKFWNDIKHYPTAIVGLILIAIVIFMAIYTMVAIPYDKAVILWRGDEADTYRHPEKVPPVWVNWFRSEKLPEGFYSVLSEEGAKNVSVEDNTKDGLQDKTYIYTFDYNETDYLQEFGLYINTNYKEKSPFLEAVMITPDGREVNVANGGISPIHRFFFSQDKKLERRVGGVNPIIGLFSTPESVKAGNPEVLTGKYTLKIRLRAFEPETTFKAEAVAYGKVYGIGGTDHLRRDISTALFWGAPIALAFGLIAAFGVSILTLSISAAGTWFGGWIDSN